jgi:hypothetical protein
MAMERSYQAGLLMLREENYALMEVIQLRA